ncbi:MAG: porin [Thiohalospira sp.]
MRNKLVATAIAGLVAAPMAQADSEVSWFGFSQITAEQQAETGNGDGGGFAFGADRVRIGYKADFDSGAFSMLQMDFNQNTASSGYDLPAYIKDAKVGYDFGPASVMAGQFKTPVGMDFNTSGKKLDITKRGMEKSLVMERAAGAMLAGKAEGLGYKVGVFNPTTRGATDAEPSGTTGPDNDPVVGEDYAYAGNLSYGMGKMLHAEIGYGVSQASATGLDDYEVMDIGLKSQPMPNLTLKAEYIDGTNYNNVDGNDRNVWYGHAGYEFTPFVEGVVRHYQSSDDPSDTDYSETFVGANFFLNPDVHHESRIQLNYVLPGGDTEDVANHAGAKAVTDDAGEATGTFLAQFQTSF